MKTQIAALVLALAAAQSFAATPTFTLTLKDHTFEPKELTVPAGKKIKLMVVNNDPTPAEFESKTLAREKLIPGNSTGVVIVGPLKPGRYDFVEEFHEKQDGAQGTLIVQ